VVETITLRAANAPPNRRLQLTATGARDRAVFESSLRRAPQRQLMRKPLGGTKGVGMRLYLSSFKLGNNPNELVKLAKGKNNLRIIMNALDHDQKTRDSFYSEQKRELEKLSFIPSELDLRSYFGEVNSLREILNDTHILWINGGNSFILRRAMRASGFDTVIHEYLENDSILYAGFSAAAVITAFSMRGLEFVDNPNVLPEKYPSHVIWDGLSILNYSIVVHYDSDHSESKLVNKEIEYYESNNIPYKKIRDGQVIIVDGNETRII
jgi:dipeptidase E